MKKVASESLPHDPESSKPVTHDTAASMFARRAAEVAAAFPASWSAKPKPSHSAAKKKVDTTSSMARNVAFRQHQLHKYLLDRAKEDLTKNEMQTKYERKQAAVQGAKELHHLKDVSEKVDKSEFF